MMRGNPRQRFFLMVFLVGLLGAKPRGWAEAAPELALARQGRTLAVLVLPESPDPTERVAADELQRYVKQMVGEGLVEAKKSSPVGDRPVVEIGATTDNREMVAAASLSDPDAFVIDVHADGVRICGLHPRGTLFGVYRFLERFCACMWLAPGIDDIPSAPSLRVPTGRLVAIPDFIMRLFNGRRELPMEWGVKVGLNGYYTAATRVRHGNCYYMPDAIPGCHTYHRVIPADTMFKLHPEWFPLIGGRRVPGNIHGAQLCVTAEGLADAFAAFIIRLFDEDPYCRLTSISPNDGRGWCECERCTALDQRLCGGRNTAQGLAGERPFRGDRVFWFANQVAERVAKKYPDKLLLVLAYINYAEPPDTIVPLPNVVPYLCHYAPADYSRSINDPSSAPNAQFNKLLRRWVSLSPNLLFYSYVSKSMWWHLPRPILHTFTTDLVYLYSLGVRQYYCQSTLSDWALDGPLYYVLAHLLWDIDADVDTLAAAWTGRMFGPGAEAMSRFYRAVETSVRKSGKPYSDNPPRDVPGLYVPEYLDQAEEALSAASAAVADREPYAGRVAEVRDIFRYGRLVIRGIEADTRFREQGDPEAARHARRYLTEALAIRKVREVRRYLENLRFSEKMGVVARGFGDTEVKGERDCWNSDETGKGDGRAGWATFLAPIEDRDQGIRLVLDVWGESDLETVVVNTGGQGKSYADGGVWTPVSPKKPLSGKPRWDRLQFDVPADLLPKNLAGVLVGLGGGDSQIWISGVKVERLAP